MQQTQIQIYININIRKSIFIDEITKFREIKYFVFVFSCRVVLATKRRSCSTKQKENFLNKSILTRTQINQNTQPFNPFASIQIKNKNGKFLIFQSYEYMFFICLNCSSCFFCIFSSWLIKITTLHNFFFYFKRGRNALMHFLESVYSKEKQDRPIYEIHTFQLNHDS